MNQMNKIIRSLGIRLLFFALGLASAALAHAKVDEERVKRMVLALLASPAKIVLVGTIRLDDGSAGFRVELPFDDLEPDTQKRAARAGWKSNDLVVILIVKGMTEYSMCHADGSDGC